MVVDLDIPAWTLVKWDLISSVISDHMLTIDCIDLGWIKGLDYEPHTYARRNEQTYTDVCMHCTLLHFTVLDCKVCSQVGSWVHISGFTYCLVYQKSSNMIELNGEQYIYIISSNSILYQTYVKFTLMYLRVLVWWHYRRG